MTCVVCKQGETKAGTAAVTFSRDTTVLVVTDVPAEICQDCGEEYVDEETADRLLTLAEEAACAGVQIEVRTYVAA